MNRVLVLNPEQSRQLAAAVRAAQRVEVYTALASLYRDFGAEVQRRRPVCRTSGRCCRFEEFGHRLFVTTMELATFAGALQAGPTGNLPTRRHARIPLPMLAPGGAAGACCPFQRDNLCSVHAIRPLGCRVFFCDESSTDWQREQYEQLHGRLRALHGALGIDYFYVEWLAALNAIGIGPPSL